MCPTAAANGTTALNIGGEVTINHEKARLGGMKLPRDLLLVLSCRLLITGKSCLPCLEWKQSFLHLAAEINLLRGRPPKVLVHNTHETRELLLRVGQFLDRARIQWRAGYTFCGNSVVEVHGFFKQTP